MRDEARQRSMRDEARGLEVCDERAALDGPAAERARQRLAPRAGPAPAQTPLDALRREARERTDPGEAGGIVRVEVSERQSRAAVARPVLVVKVELLPADEEPQPTAGPGRELRLGRSALEGSPESPWRLAFDPASRSRDGQDGDGADTPDPWPGAPPSPGRAFPAPRPGAEPGARPRPRRLARLPITLGTLCPLCGEPMYRQPTPWFVRPLRWLLLNRGSYRRCPTYHWIGLALHR